MAYELTEQDKALLTLVAKHEAKSYDVIYGGREIPLRQMLIAEVLEYQRTQMTGGSTAVGRYQMLRDVVRENCQKLNLDPTQCRLTEDVQDIMMIDKLNRQRKYRQWKAGELGATVEENCQKFMVYLAAEWASVPVPYNMPQGSFGSGHPRRNLLKGQSFYAGDGLNKSHHDPDQFLAAVIDIYNGGSGEVTTIASVPAGGGNPANPTAAAPAGSTGYPQEGTSEAARMGNFASGGSRTAGNYGNGGSLASSLPAASAVYSYEIIDPLDDRYDFRTGKKVSRLLENGTSSVAANAPGSTNTPASDLGVAPNTGGVDPQTFTDDALNTQLNNRDAAATQPGRYSDSPNNPAVTSPVTQPSSSATARSAPNSAGGGGVINSSAGSLIPPADGLSGTLAPIKKIPNPLTTDPKTGQPTGLGASGIGNLIPPSRAISPQSSARVPGLSQTPLASTDPLDPTNPQNNQDATKQTLADDLQSDVDDIRAQVADIIESMNAIYQEQPSEYLTELEDDLDELNSQLSDLEDELDDAIGAEITVLQQRIFSVQGSISLIERKINLGSPYGLSVNSAQTRAKQDPEYSSHLTELRALLTDDLEQIKTKARSNSIDLKKSNYSANYQSVPPVVTFRD